jgi:pimeloyl-ACP methyl ester carboxylesterase
MLRSTSLAGLSLLVAAPLAACSGDDATGGAGGSTSSATTTSTAGDGGSGGSGGGSFVLAAAWSPCPLDSTKSRGDDAECATVTVPLDWDARSGETIEIFVKRWPRFEAEAATAHLWLVQGGPGSASVEWEGRIDGPAAAFPSTQFYMHDPRGVGRSSRLGCPAEEDTASEGGIDITTAEWPSCLAAVQAEVGSALQKFTIDNAARDLGELIEAISGELPVTVLGQSYGTLLPQRYLHHYPGQPEAVVLDSLANPGGTFTRFSERTDRVGHDLLELCGADGACRARLGPDPAQAIDDAFTFAFEEDGCPALEAGGATRAALARALYGLLTFPEYRPMVFPVVARLARCNADDVTRLLYMLDVFAPGGAPSLDERLFGHVLYTNLVLSEMWDADAPTPAEHLAELQSIEFGLIDVGLDERRAYWPVYPPSPLNAVYPDVSVPMLMMNGTLDAQTPLEEAQQAEAHYTAATQTFVVVPGAAHGAVAGEPWSQPGPPCTVTIIESFVGAPSQPLDTSCIALVDPVPLEPTSQMSAVIFGTADAWGDGMAVALTAADSERAGNERQRLRDRVALNLRRARP